MLIYAILILYLFCLLSCGKLLTKPANVVRGSSKNVTFSCETNSEKETVSWEFKPFNSSTHTKVVLGGVLFNGNNERYRIHIEQRRIDLIIDSLDETYAGTYTCVDDDGAGDRASAKLTVIRVNEYNGGRVNVSFVGDLIPVGKCTPFPPAASFINSCTVTFNLKKDTPCTNELYSVICIPKGCEQDQECDHNPVDATREVNDLFDKSSDNEDNYADGERTTQKLNANTEREQQAPANVYLIAGVAFVVGIVVGFIATIVVIAVRKAIRRKNKDGSNLNSRDPILTKEQYT